MQVLIKKYQIFFICKFFSIFGHQNPGSGLDPEPDPYSAYNAGSGLNESESETLAGTVDLEKRTRYDT